MQNKKAKREYLCNDGDLFKTLQEAVEHTLGVLLLTDEEIEQALKIEEWFECKNCKHRLLVLNNETEAIHLEGGTKCLSPDEKQENLCKCVKPEFDLLLPILKAGVSKGAN